jgi:hypothetical protein
MRARFTGRSTFSWIWSGHANPALALGLFLALLTAEIRNVQAITACLRRQKASLSQACRAVFEQ